MLWGRRGLMPKINISPMEKDDISEIVKLERLYFSQPWSEKAFLDAFAGGNSYFVVAKARENLVVGYGGMYFVGGEGYIYNIAVKEDFRGQKIGQKIIKSLIDYSLERNLEFLSLEVRESNLPAINLYKKMGFTTVGKRKDFYSFPKEDALIMTLFLK